MVWNYNKVTGYGMLFSAIGLTIGAVWLTQYSLIWITLLILSLPMIFGGYHLIITSKDETPILHGTDFCIDCNKSLNESQGVYCDECLQKKENIN